MTFCLKQSLTRPCLSCFNVQMHSLQVYPCDFFKTCPKQCTVPGCSYSVDTRWRSSAIRGAKGWRVLCRAIRNSQVKDPAAGARETQTAMDQMVNQNMFCRVLYNLLFIIQLKIIGLPSLNQKKKWQLLKKSVVLTFSLQYGLQCNNICL